MAEFQILTTGYIGDRTASTVSLVRCDDGAVVVIDPGMVSSSERILGPLRDTGVDPTDVTDVVISHHHPDHTINIALFPNARVHDHWAIYHQDLWTSRPAEGFELASDVVLWETPGHTPQDITTVVTTGAGVVVFTHLWWSDQGPADDPYATDSEALHQGRVRVLEVADLIVPGHGAPFEPGPATPR